MHLKFIDESNFNVLYSIFYILRLYVYAILKKFFNLHVLKFKVLI